MLVRLVSALSLLVAAEAGQPRALLRRSHREPSPYERRKPHEHRARSRPTRTGQMVDSVFDAMDHEGERSAMTRDAATIFGAGVEKRAMLNRPVHDDQTTLINNIVHDAAALFGGRGGSRQPNPLMNRIKKMRCEVCVNRPSLAHHGKCVRFLTMMCKQGDGGPCKEACGKFKEHLAKACYDTYRPDRFCELHNEVFGHYPTRDEVPDADGDGVPDEDDLFPHDPKVSKDSDNDLIGDALDPDRDGDGIHQEPQFEGDKRDAFPDDPKENHDTDKDGTGDNSDPDIDDDGIKNEEDEDANGDGSPDELNSGNDVLEVLGDDKTKIPEELELKPPEDEVKSTKPTKEWLDTDGDGIPDGEDKDTDGDGVLDIYDKFPDDKHRSHDMDHDGIADSKDKDRDGDGRPNSRDIFPDNPREHKDLDGDGVGDNLDYDRDGDGFHNHMDGFPDNATKWAGRDSDMDGIDDTKDLFKNDPNEWKDVDGNGVGDNADPDRDGDKIPNAKDRFPDNAKESADSDGDGVGDTEDPRPKNAGCYHDSEDLPCQDDSVHGDTAHEREELTEPEKQYVDPATLNKVMRPLPSQGNDELSGELVEHKDRTTATEDWQGEWPQNEESEAESIERICARSPNNTWCKIHRHIRHMPR